MDNDKWSPYTDKGLNAIQFLNVILAIFFLIGALAEVPLEKYGIKWCFGKNTSADLKQLQCLQSLQETRILKVSFAEIIKRRRTCRHCKEVVIGESQYFKYFKFPFMVIDIGFVSRGTGTKVHFIFKQGPPIEFEGLLMVNDVDTNELAVIQPKSSTESTANFIIALRSKKFDSIWNSLQ